MNPAPLTEAERARIARLVAGGFTNIAVGEAVGRHETTVRRAVAAIGGRETIVAGPARRGERIAPEEDATEAQAVSRLRRIGPVFPLRILRPEADPETWLVWGNPKTRSEMLAMAEK